MHFGIMYVKLWENKKLDKKRVKVVSYVASRYRFVVKIRSENCIELVSHDKSLFLPLTANTWYIKNMFSVEQFKILVTTQICKDSIRLASD